jgi:hypothetical protein
MKALFKTSLFLMAAFAPATFSQTADAGNDGSDSAIMLAGDWLPDDPHQIDYSKLPRVPAEHAIISDVRDRAGAWVHQHAYLAHHDGRYWAMWSDGPGLPKPGATPEQHRNIVPGHDRPDTRNSYATSRDGLRWSRPADLTGPRPLEARRRTAGPRQSFQRAGIHRSRTEPGGLPLGRRELGRAWHGSR